MGRSLHRSDERRAGHVATKASELLGGNDDDFIATVHRDVLRPFAPDAPNELTEAGLRIPQEPLSAAGVRVPRMALGRCGGDADRAVLVILTALA